MSLVVNHDLMAMNAARNLNSSYNKLSTSTRRLSSGLRVDTAADDAAGLAIRELMRAEISGMQQGVRNANDGISLIQTADGALQVVDEKLIRMKELAEQAATGTYDSTQRLLIESEYQQMASEITRIANATDFNGIKLLDGTLSGAHDGSGLVSKGELKIHFGTGNDSAEDYYYIQIGNCTASALGLGNASTLDAGHDISTQENAQKALEAITAAIVSKDNIRAHLARHTEQAGKHHHQPVHSGRKPPGRRVPHFRRGRGHGNDEFRPQPNPDSERGRHARSGQLAAPDGHAAHRRLGHHTIEVEADQRHRPGGLAPRPGLENQCPACAP